MNLGDFEYPEEVARAIDLDVTEEDKWMEIVDLAKSIQIGYPVLALMFFLGFLFFGYKLSGHIGKMKKRVVKKQE